MTSNMEEQTTLFDLDLWSSRMSLDSSEVMEAKTFESSWSPSSESSSRPPMFLDLRAGGGWTPSGAIVGDGWSLAWRLHDARFWGVAQRRKRLSIVADFGSERASEILFEREGLPWDSEPSGEEREETSRATSYCADSSRGRDRDGNLLTASTLTATYYKGCGTRNGEERDVVLCYPIEGNGSRPSHMGNGFTDEDISYTLNATEHHAVAYRKTGHPMNARDPQNLEEAETNDTLNTFDMSEARSSTLVVGYDARGNSWDETAPTLTGDHQRRVSDYTGLVADQPSFQRVLAYGISPYHSEGMKSDNPTSGFYKAETSRTIDSGGGSPTCNQGGMAIVQDINESYGAHAGSYNGQDAHNDMLVANTIAVRRLTPLECERLQGFPDGWTDIGDFVDTNGKIRKTTDSARYKALGNALAVGYANNKSGFWMWLMKRITDELGRTGTLGSLFDGIGGFPLAWETYNGRGSARWASEIEEFPIAVTKKRFGEE